MFKLETKLPRSSIFVRWASLISSAPNASMDSGMDCTVSERLRAVTMISARPVSAFERAGWQVGASAPRAGTPAKMDAPSAIADNAEHCRMRGEGAAGPGFSIQVHLFDECIV